MTNRYSDSAVIPPPWGARGGADLRLSEFFLIFYTCLLVTCSWAALQTNLKKIYFFSKSDTHGFTVPLSSAARFFLLLLLFLLFFCPLKFIVIQAEALPALALYGLSLRKPCRAQRAACQ